MKYLKICLIIVLIDGLVACNETGKQDTTTHDADTMVIKENSTDNPTNVITRDTTRR